MSRDAWPKPCPDTYHTIVATPASERRAQHVVQRLRGDEGHVSTQVLGDVLEIGGVQCREDESVDAVAPRGQRLLADAADRQDEPRERDLSRHRDVFASGLIA